MNKNIFIRKIAEENISGDYEVTYCLYEISSVIGKIYYAVEIICGEDSDLGVVGTDIESAKAFYYSLLRSGTTPVALCEIISDKIQSMKY